jgi:hypothetical protein
MASRFRSRLFVTFTHYSSSADSLHSLRPQAPCATNATNRWNSFSLDDFRQSFRCAGQMPPPHVIHLLAVTAKACEPLVDRGGVLRGRSAPEGMRQEYPEDAKDEALAMGGRERLPASAARNQIFFVRSVMHKHTRNRRDRLLLTQRDLRCPATSRAGHAVDYRPGPLSNESRTAARFSLTPKSTCLMIAFSHSD